MVIIIKSAGEGIESQFAGTIRFNISFIESMPGNNQRFQKGKTTPTCSMRIMVIAKTN